MPMSSPWNIATLVSPCPTPATGTTSPWRTRWPICIASTCCSISSTRAAGRQRASARADRPRCSIVPTIPMMSTCRCPMWLRSTKHSRTDATSHSSPIRWERLPTANASRTSSARCSSGVPRSSRSSATTARRRATHSVLPSTRSSTSACWSIRLPSGSGAHPSTRWHCPRPPTASFSTTSSSIANPTTSPSSRLTCRSTCRRCASWATTAMPRGRSASGSPASRPTTTCTV